MNQIKQRTNPNKEPDQTNHQVSFNQRTVNKFHKIANNLYTSDNPFMNKTLLSPARVPLVQPIDQLSASYSIYIEDVSNLLKFFVK